MAQPRKTIVLRAGPPEHRKHAWDWVALGLGVVLLAASVALVDWLPEEDIILPQFRVAVTEVAGEQFPTQRAQLAAGSQQDLAYDIPDANVFRFVINVAIQDQEPSTMPDRFELELVDPAGETVGDTQAFQTPPARPKSRDELLNSTDPQQPFVAEMVSATFEFTAEPRPTDAVVDAATRDETLAEAGDRVLPTYQRDTAGTWLVRVRLVEAGGCPQPSGDPDAAFQSAICHRDLPPNGIDPGNEIVISTVDHVFYGVSLMVLA